MSNNIACFNIMIILKSWFCISNNLVGSLNSGHQLIYNLCMENDLSKCRSAESTFG